MGSARCAAGAAVLDGKLYAMAGVGGGGMAHAQHGRAIRPDHRCLGGAEVAPLVMSRISPFLHFL